MDRFWRTGERTPPILHCCGRGREEDKNLYEEKWKGKVYLQEGNSNSWKSENGRLVKQIYPVKINSNILPQQVLWRGRMGNQSKKYDGGFEFFALLFFPVFPPNIISPFDKFGNPCFFFFTGEGAFFVTMRNSQMRSLREIVIRRHELSDKWLKWINKWKVLKMSNFISKLYIQGAA